MVSTAAILSCDGILRTAKRLPDHMLGHHTDFKMLCLNHDACHHAALSAAQYPDVANPLLLCQLVRGQILRADPHLLGLCFG